MSVLLVTTDEVLSLCRLDNGVTANSEDGDSVIALGQDGYEAMLRPDVLSDLEFRPLLRRNVAKLLAADLLDIRYRDNGGPTSLQGAGITMGSPPDLGQKLREEAMAVLQPYLRVPRANLGITTTTTSAASQAGQETLFRATEFDRVVTPQEQGF